MLPVTHGARRNAHADPALLASLLAPLGLAPVVRPGSAAGSTRGRGRSAARCSSLLAVRVARSHAGEEGEGGDIYARARRQPARDLFAFSILYLFALFAALIAEHALGLD